MRSQDSKRSVGRRWLLPALLVSIAVGPRSLHASYFKIEFDDRSVHLITQAFERRRMDRGLTNEIVQTPGYRLLFDQVAAQTTPRRSPDEVAAEFHAALASALEGEESSFGLDGVRANPERYRVALGEFRRVARSVQWVVAERLNEVLPPVSDFTSTAHLIVGGDASGFAFSDRSDVSLRFDDFVGSSRGGPLDVDQLASTLCHELFHVGFRLAGGQPPRPAPPDIGWYALAHVYGPELVGEVWRASGLKRWNAEAVEQRLEAWVPPREWDVRAVDRFLALLSRVQNEGSATYADVPMRDISGDGAAEIEFERWMRSIDADFEFLARVTERLGNGAGPREIDEFAGRGFRDAGPLYRVGYRMAERIASHSGRRPFLATVEAGPLEFFEAYFQSHPHGSGHIRSATEDEIERVIREIRALGAFDPDG